MTSSYRINLRHLQIEANRWFKLTIFCWNFESEVEEDYGGNGGDSDGSEGERYRHISDIRGRTKSRNLNVSRLALQFFVVQSIEARCWVKNENIVGAAPTGDAPTTSEWSTI